MAHCRTIDKNTTCAPKPVDSQAHPCEPFSVCLPFGATLRYDGVCLRLTEALAAPPDGTYGKIVVQDGCITEVLPDAPAVYTPPPCYPEPDPCGGGDDWPGVSPAQGNILQLLVDGLYAGVAVQSTASATLSGLGTLASPLRVDVAFPPVDVTLLSGTPDVIPISGNGSLGQPYNISHRIGTSGSYNGLTFDAYGHLTSYEPPTSGAIETVTAGPGIDAQTTGTQVTIALESVVKNGGTWTCGGMEITVDIYGRVIDIQRGITVVPGTFRSDRGLVTLNAFGSVTQLQPYAPPMDFQFSQQVSGAVEAEVTVTPGMSGRLRIGWTGAVAEPIIHVEGNLISPAVVTAAGVQALTSMTFPGGAPYVVRLTAPAGDTLTGILDVWVVA